jgi:hypothetical protein
VDSGLASVVISASADSAKLSRTLLSTAANRSAPSSEGVPPPTNTVSTLIVPMRFAASVSSVCKALSQPSGVAPPNSAGV